MFINDFSDLTNFFNEEFTKRIETYNGVQPSAEFLKETEDELRKYGRLYYIPLYKRAKRDLKVQIAIDTMPHGRIWKFFHKKLWLRMEMILNEQVKEEPRIAPKPSTQKANVVYPDVVRPMDVPQPTDNV